MVPVETYVHVNLHLLSSSLVDDKLWLNDDPAIIGPFAKD